MAKITIEDARERVRQNPEAFENHAILGELLYQSSQYEEAASSLKEATYFLGALIGNTPPNASHVGMFPRELITRMQHDLHLMHGDCLVKLERYEEASETVRKGLGLIDEDPDGWNLLGVALANGQDVEGALSAFREAVRHNPSRRDLWENLHRCYTALRRPEADAVALILKEKKDLEDDMALLADLFIKGGEYERAQLVIDTLLKWNSKDRRVLMPESRLHIINGDYKKAAKVLETIIKDDKSDTDAMWHLARVNAILGDKKKSMKFLESLLSLDSNHANAIALKQILDTPEADARVPFGVMIHRIHNFEREEDEVDEDRATQHEYCERPELSMPVGSTVEDALHFMGKGEFFRVTEAKEMPYKSLTVFQKPQQISISPFSIQYPVSKSAAITSEFARIEPYGYDIAGGSGGDIGDVIQPGSTYWFLKTSIHPLQRVGMIMTYSMMKDKAFQN